MDIDKLFFERVVEAGYIARERIEEARGIAEGFSTRARSRALPDVLAESGLIDANAARRVWSAVVTAGPKGAVGGFLMLEELRAGVFGRVYLSERIADGAAASLLVLDDPGRIKRLQKSLKTAEACPAGLVRVIDLGEADGRAFIAMEHVRGEETLGSRIQRSGPLSERDALRIGLKLTEAVEAIHADGLPRRAVRPDNVLLFSDGTARLAEPDLAEGGLAEDIVGLGLTMFAALTGEASSDSTRGRPFLADLFNPAVSMNLANAVAYMLTRNPDDRYSDAASIRNDLVRIAEGQPPLQASRGMTDEPEEELHRVLVGREQWNIPAVLAAAAAALVFALALVGRAPADPEFRLLDSGDGGMNASTRRDAPTETAFRDDTAIEASEGQQDVVMPEAAPSFLAAEESSGSASDAIADHLQTEEAARLRAEETARLQAEEAVRLQAEETAGLQAEETAGLQAETARLHAEETAKLQAEEVARLQTEETAKLQAEEETRLQAEEKRRLEAEKAERDAAGKAQKEERRADEKRRQEQEHFAAKVMQARIALNEGRLDDAEALLVEAWRLRECDEVKALTRDVRFSRHVGIARAAKEAGDADTALKEYTAARALRDGLEVRAGIEETWRVKRLAHNLDHARAFIESGQADHASVELARARELARGEELPRVEALEEKLARNQSVSGEQPLNGTPESGKEDASALPSRIVDSIGMEFALVPAGSFLSGGDPIIEPSPQRSIHLDAYYIALHEVTNAQYERFRPGHRSQWRKYSSDDEHPAIAVTWDDAAAFCGWLSELEGATYRLPTEAEWEKAARGPGGRQFPWGDGPPLVSGVWRANFAPRSARARWGDDGFDLVAPVGSYPEGASVYGALDMAGNVWEWVSDWYSASYYANGSDRNPTGPDSGVERVLRGGSFTNGLDALRTTNRVFRPPIFYEANVGFRCVREVQREGDR